MCRGGLVMKCVNWSNDCNFIQIKSMHSFRGGKLKSFIYIQLCYPFAGAFMVSNELIMMMCLFLVNAIGFLMVNKIVLNFQENSQLLCSFINHKHAWFKGNRWMGK